MKINAIKTDVFELGGDLFSFITKHVGTPLKNDDILAVTSKIVSLAESRVVPLKGTDKVQLIKNESDHYLGEIGYGCHLTIKHGLLIPSAGIDESNSKNNNYILYPLDPCGSAKGLHRQLKEHYSLSRLGILITDSHTHPLRQGVLGAGLSHWGFYGINNQVGEKDLFGRTLKMTKQNIVDSLSAAAVLLMGEGAQSKPLAVIRNAPVEFTNEDVGKELHIPVEEDLYYPLYQALL